MPILMSVLLKYFWFGMILLAVVNVWFVQKRARPLIAQNPLLRFDADRVSITLLLVMGIPCALLGIIQLLAGFDSPLYIFSDDLSDPFLVSAWGVMAGLRVYILYWLWFTNGLESYLAVTPIKITKPQWFPEYFAQIPGIKLIRFVVTTILLCWFAIVIFSFND